MVETIVREKEIIKVEPKFRDPNTLTEEQLTDPDYRLKQLAKLNGDDKIITCSKCHHCR